MCGFMSDENIVYSLTLKEAYMCDLCPRIISSDIGDSSMPCLELQDTQGYSGGYAWIELEMGPPTLEDVYTENYVAALTFSQFEEYFSVFMPLFLEEIKKDLVDGVEKTKIGQRREIQNSLPVN